MNLAARVLLEALRFDREPEDEVRRRAERALAAGAGGFVLFGGEAERVARRVEEWRGAVRHRLWIAADLERGPGQQFTGLPELPPPAGLAAHPDPEGAAREAGRLTGRGARRVGVDLVLAPVLDLDVEARNPIVGTRSFGADPRLVGRLGRAWIEGCQAEGVAACAKHFPGHGRTTRDSHDVLPRVTAGRGELEEDLAPFRAVAPHVAAVMAAHVAFPALGSERPATLEPEILAGLLREGLGFEGLVLTDALNMGGFAAAAAGGEAAEANGTAAALLAGCDLLLYPSDFAAAAAALDRAALASPRVGDRVEEALRRGRDTVRRFRLAGRPEGVDRDAAPGAPGARDTAAAAALARDCIRAPDALPAGLGPDRPVRVRAVWDDRPDPGRAPFGAAFAAALAARGWAVEEGPPEGGAPWICLVAATPQAWKGTAGLTEAGRAAVAAAGAAAGRFPVVFGHPRVLAGLSSRGAGLCAWSAETAMERAAALRLDELARAGQAARPAAGPAAGPEPGGEAGRDSGPTPEGGR
ncbi:MAG: glycoside hydrolase family 3 N-terminal domain-containing protein [Gemmatimonadota bacterium]|nr:glycoside hydrolase family 3 N-terminal domain-containing protein [Gemmatimonadota bacterium]